MLRCFPLLAATVLAMAATLIAPSAEAKVLAEGKPSQGVYWQKIKKSDGTVSYLCRATGESKIQKNKKCEKAKAAKP